MSRANFGEDGGPAFRVAVEFLTVEGDVRASTILGPYSTRGAASGQATYARSQATRNGGRVRTRLERSLNYWETLEVIEE